MQDGRHSDNGGQVAGNLDKKGFWKRRPTALITEGQRPYLQLLARFCPRFSMVLHPSAVGSGKVRFSGTWMPALQNIGCKFDLEEHHKCVS